VKRKLVHICRRRRGQLRSECGAGEDVHAPARERGALLRVLLEEAVVFEFLELFGLALVDPFLGLGLLAGVDLGAKGSGLKGSGFGGRFGQGSAAAAWSGQRGARRGKGGER
jgi:hypothetical protein